jgi:hypothetical protein
MTTISARVIADSKCAVSGKRITTVLLRYPRWVHAELMTHRQFSRNASSSRAIPVKRLLMDMLRDPAYPIYWGSNQKGMQAGAPLTGWRLATVRGAWWLGKWAAAGAAWLADKAGAHKQVVNRLIEPFCHINVVVTSTEWSNWFALRDHNDAEPHIRHLAVEMDDAMEESWPVLLRAGQWHVPFVNVTDENGETAAASGDVAVAAIKLSVARCARTSYFTHEGKLPDVDEDLKLHDRLVASVPLHASPAEHQATPDPYGENRDQWGNFDRFKQYRKTLHGECQ